MDYQYISQDDMADVIVNSLRQCEFDHLAHTGNVAVIDAQLAKIKDDDPRADQLRMERAQVTGYRDAADVRYEFMLGLITPDTIERVEAARPESPARLVVPADK